MWLYDHDWSISISVFSYVCPIWKDRRLISRITNKRIHVAQWYEMSGIHTLLLCSASCLHMLILHLHLSHASCNRNKHWVLCLLSTLPISTITVYDSIDKIHCLLHAHLNIAAVVKNGNYASCWLVTVNNHKVFVPIVQQLLDWF